MCSFVRVGSPKALQTSLEPNTASPLKMNSLGRMRTPEIMEVGLTQEKKDDLIDRALGDSKSSTDLGLGMRLGQNPRWRERMASPETKSPPCHALGVGLERRNLSRTPMEPDNLGRQRGSPFQGPKPLGVLPGRVESEKEGLLPRFPYGGTLQPPLGTEFASPQAAGSTGRPVTCGPARTEAIAEKQPVVGLEFRKGLEKEPSCVVVNPYAEKPSEKVDIGLPQTQEPGESKNAEPQIGLVTEPCECPFAQQPEEEKEPTAMEPGVEAPAHIRPIYSGKFFDRMPCLPSAGKVKPVGYRVATCLTEKLPRLTTPPEAKKYFNFRYPPPGEGRVFYGRANDPQIAPYLTHGIRTKFSIPVSTLVNPQPITTFQQKIKDKKESIYFSNQRAPLGKSHDQTPGLPKGMDIINTTFGSPIIRELSASGIVNPPKAFEDVFKEGQEGHDLYIVSHHDYFAGIGELDQWLKVYSALAEGQILVHRTHIGQFLPTYNSGSNGIQHSFLASSIRRRAMLAASFPNSQGRPGFTLLSAIFREYAAGHLTAYSSASVVPIVSSHKGKVSFFARKRGAKITSQRVDDFKEKFQHKLGRVLDPIAETMNVDPGHTFGACLKPEDYGAGDLIHYRRPGEYLRGKDRQRAVIAAARHHLKKFNYQHFNTLLSAFRHYDKKGDGMIDREELHEACDQANLHLDKVLLDQLFDYCDVDQDGLISYLEFANFLNWKDKVPLTEYEKRVIIKGTKPDCENITETSMGEAEPTLLIRPEDIVPKEPGSSEETLRVLLRPSDKVSKHYKTTSSEISATVGAVPSICYPIYGVPTVRSDIPAPRIRRISDRNNYGEDGNAYSLLHPSIFSQKGVFERDFFKARSKEEISNILTNIGVKLSDEEFENVWNLASKKHHRGEVCVETIRNVLDELQHAGLVKCKTVM
ncbi:EF-hand domain-containing family member B [Arvicola amphibius]|uniref:EF-hand domain-containing family member B n=1 Tax=Arvicola amphibius TaxID=1047088 RepID=UPI001C09B090|nr:EF-hand domain-containing family member B [Arvicola amphibius]